MALYVATVTSPSSQESILLFVPIPPRASPSQTRSNRRESQPKFPCLASHIWQSTQTIGRRQLRRQFLARAAHIVNATSISPFEPAEPWRGLDVAVCLVRASARGEECCGLYFVQSLGVILEDHSSVCRLR